MIEESERLKSNTEKRAYDLADKLVPWCLAGSGLTYLLTGNITRAVSVPSVCCRLLHQHYYTTVPPFF